MWLAREKPAKAPHMTTTKYPFGVASFFNFASNDVQTKEQRAHSSGMDLKLNSGVRASGTP